MSGCVIFYGNDDGNAAPCFKFAADSVAGAFGRHQNDVNASGRFDVTEADVEAVTKNKRFSIAQVRGYIL